MATPSCFGRTTLIGGSEPLLADRRVNEILQGARAEDPAVEVEEADAGPLDAIRLAEITSPSLFAQRQVVLIRDLAELPVELADQLVTLARSALEDLALVLVHGGGPKGKPLVNRLVKSGAAYVDCAPLKAWELPQFVTAEIGAQGGTIEPEAGQLLVDAVGHDLRALAAAAAQLVSDSDGTITPAVVRSYFAGRAEVTSFAVSDALLSGRTAVALEQLRWALSTGVAPVLITSALASGLRSLGKLVSAGSGLREADLAREVGVPPWKLKTMRSQARGWDAGGIAAALKVVARADADVKGAASDAEFSLERAVLSIGRARQAR